MANGSPEAKPATNGKTTRGTNGKATHVTNGKTTHGTELVRLSQRELLGALRALRRGEFAVRLPEHFSGLDAQLASAFNDIAQTAEALEQDSRDAFVAVGSE